LVKIHREIIKKYGGKITEVTESDYTYFEKQHRRKVEKALAEGKPVPANVLAEYPDISLMLSGHTHGMQFGLETPFFKWSPVQWMYSQWAGLYEDGNQKLYVNRGFGFLGYPGRVGILPEITVIELV
jgi:hypothetical protein